MFVLLAKKEKIDFGGHLSYNKLEVKADCSTKDRDDFGGCGTGMQKCAGLPFTCQLKFS